MSLATPPLSGAAKSVPLGGMVLWKALSKIVDGQLVTHEPNRENIRKRRLAAEHHDDGQRRANAPIYVWRTRRSATMEEDGRSSSRPARSPSAI
jgi:hypothetical protein